MDRKQSLLQFYEKCVEKGYTDMSNDAQRLDAKVVAADFQIKYKDISKLFDEARAEAEREMIDGQLLVTVEDTKNSLKVYLRPDQSVYSVMNGGDKIEGTPRIAVQKGGTLSYTYNPAKAIYTSATVGGITTGGVEYTKASYSEKVVGSGKGYIEVSLAGKTFTANTISFSSFVRERFKRDDSFQRFAGATGIISCRKTSLYRNAVLNSLSNRDYQQQMTLLSQVADEERLPYSECVQIADLLGRVVSKVFPPLDEDIYSQAIALLKSNAPDQIDRAEKLLLSMLDYKDVTAIIYKRAVNLSSSNTSSELNHAIELFNSVSDYKDSKSRINDLHGKIETVIHEEKKAAFLKKESLTKRVKKLAMSGAIAIVVLMIGAVIFSNVIIPTIHYRTAEKLLAEGNRLEALAEFDAAGKYQDARERSMYLWNYTGRRSSLAAGTFHAVGLKSDGSVVAVGNNYDGQCDVDSWSGIVAIAAGDKYTIGLRSDGTVVAAGDNKDGQCDVDSWSGIVAIAAGDEHTVGLKSNGTVVTVGDTSLFRGEASKWKGIVAIAAGRRHTVGLKSDGSVVAVGGLGLVGEHLCDVGDWKDIVAIAAGDEHTVGLRCDGTVVAVGENRSGQCNVSGWTDIVAIDAGDYHTVGLRSDGTVVAVGDNHGGQCDVSDWTDIVAIAAGYENTVGLRSDGTVLTGADADNVFGLSDVCNWANIRTPNVEEQK